MKRLLVAVFALPLVAAGCTQTEKGAGIGAASGAIIGGAVTGNVRGAAVGGAVGGLTGAAIGNASESCTYRDRYGRTHRGAC